MPIQNRLWAAIAAACAAIMLAGCESVTSPHLLGTPVAPDASQIHSLSGTWIGKDGNAVKVRQQAGGQLVIAGVGGERVNGEFTFKLIQLRGQFTADDGSYFVNILPVEEAEETDGEPRYSILRVIGDAEQLLILQPANVAAWREVIERGKLPGSVEKSEHSLEVKLDATAKQLSDYVTAENVHRLFDVDHPVIFRRTTDVPPAP